MKLTRKQLRTLIYENIVIAESEIKSQEKGAKISGHSVIYSGNIITIDGQNKYKLTLVGPSKNAGWQSSMISGAISAAGHGEGSPVNINSIAGTTIKGSVGSLPGDIDLKGDLLEELEKNINSNSKSFVLHGPRVAIKFTRI